MTKTSCQDLIKILMKGLRVRVLKNKFKPKFLIYDTGGCYCESLTSYIQLNVIALEQRATDKINQIITITSNFKY